MTEEHTHHWVPTRTGKYTSTREPVQEMKCECGMTLAHWQWLQETLKDAPPLSEQTIAKVARLIRDN